MNLCKGMLVEWLGSADIGDTIHVERILWIDSKSTQVIVIQMAQSKALPLLRSYQEIASALSTATARILNDDFYVASIPSDNNLSTEQQRRRDRNWALIKPIVEGDAGLLVSPGRRGSAIAARAKECGRAKSDVYALSRRYWWSGGLINSLAPNFHKCGGKGKKREASPEAPKRGRPRQYITSTDEQQGVNITPRIKELFKRGVRRFYETLEGRSFTDAYALTIGAFFNEGFTLVDGVPTPVLPPENKLPSERQFRYWYDAEYRDAKREQEARYGSRTYLLKGREMLGNSTQMAFGPGSHYQIDATIGDIFLVSSFDRTRIIGRPVVYLCVDIFSRMIVGFSVTLEGPSWLGAMLALDNVVTDKVEYCAEYGITISAGEWPCHQLPKSIHADRGEFEGFNADRLPNSLGVDVHNTALWRADWKGIVERNFGKANERVIHFTPGAVPRPHKRGDPDYALKAVYTLDDFRKLLICYIKDYNLNQYLKQYSMDEFMIADHVERYPVDLWEWGVANRSGSLRVMPPAGRDDFRRG